MLSQELTAWLGSSISDLWCYLVCDAEKILVVESIEERKRAKRMMRFFKGVMYMMLSGFLFS